ncbi:hypothetical protein T07_15131 [Trichinella nelsoni]|uniref:Uncharacterized protein n=1 Tax=Trichinella nelsoni TaxID=6336 RepID=A0A0V0RLZ4_9BILA|nr:hypothetical protein T07_15131 [Trichinella nelsoni]
MLRRKLKLPLLLNTMTRCRKQKLNERNDIKTFFFYNLFHHLLIDVLKIFKMKKQNMLKNLYEKKISKFDNVFNFNMNDKIV